MSSILTKDIEEVALPAPSSPCPGPREEGRCYPWCSYLLYFKVPV